MFQSTPPARAATRSKPTSPRCTRFNPRRPRGRRHFGDIGDNRGCVVSIHAAREGGDAAGISSTVAAPGFNPRRPRGRRQVVGGILRVAQRFNPRRPRGRRRGQPRRDIEFRRFNPRRPRGRRLPSLSQANRTGRFNPRRPRGRRPGNRVSLMRHQRVSIHAAREGGDHLIAAQRDCYAFQSTPPARAATTQ